MVRGARGGVWPARASRNTVQAVDEAPERALAGLDPYASMAAEAERIGAWCSALDDRGWGAPSRCAGWSVRDVVAHLASGETYNRACLDGTVGELLADLAARGATDLASANELGLADFEGWAPADILDTWRARAAENLARLRGRDGADLDTSVGPYPARRQAFHLAFELAVHADDVGVPVRDDERAARLGRLVPTARFLLAEAKPDLTIEGDEATTRVRGAGVDVALGNETFVAAVAARLPDDHDLDARVRSLCAVTP